MAVASSRKPARSVRGIAKNLRHGMPGPTPEIVERGQGDVVRRGQRNCRALIIDMAPAPEIDSESRATQAESVAFRVRRMM